MYMSKSCFLSCLSLLQGSIKAKVLDIDTDTKMASNNSPVKEFIIGDQSKNLTLSVWDTEIEKILVGKSYIITNVTSRNFKNKVKLTCTKRTKIQQIEDLQDVEDNIESAISTQINVKIQQCQITTSYKCGSCLKNIDNVDSTVSSIIRCQCGMKQKKTNLASTEYVKLVCRQTNQATKRMICFKDVLIKHCSSVNEEYNITSIENYLLEKEDFIVTYAPDSDIVVELKKNY